MIIHCILNLIDLLFPFALLLAHNGLITSLCIPGERFSNCSIGAEPVVVHIITYIYLQTTDIILLFNNNYARTWTYLFAIQRTLQCCIRIINCEGNIS